MTLQDQIEQPVRRLTARGWSTRKIAQTLHVSQATVQRTRERINTGPNPILPSAARIPRRRVPGAMAVLTVALLLLAATCTALLYTRTRAAPAPAQQVQVCVRYSPAGDITGLTGGGVCPPGFQTLTLTPGR